jgi:YHS domain-containing protein
MSVIFAFINKTEKMKKAILAFAILSIIACSQAVKDEKKEMNVATEKSSGYTPEMVVNTKDYACGMPVTAGINDTCHVDGKAYGFCSSECKAEFLKDPQKYLSQK